MAKENKKGYNVLFKLQGNDSDFSSFIKKYIILSSSYEQWDGGYNLI